MIDEKNVENEDLQIATSTTTSTTTTTSTRPPRLQKHQGNRQPDYSTYWDDKRFDVDDYQLRNDVNNNHYVGNIHANKDNDNGDEAGNTNCHADKSYNYDS